MTLLFTFNARQWLFNLVVHSFPIMSSPLRCLCPDGLTKDHCATGIKKHGTRCHKITIYKWNGKRVAEESVSDSSFGGSEQKGKEEQLVSPTWQVGVKGREK